MPDAKGYTYDVQLGSCFLSVLHTVLSRVRLVEMKTGFIHCVFLWFDVSQEPALILDVLLLLLVRLTSCTSFFNTDVCSAGVSATATVAMTDMTLITP